MFGQNEITGRRFFNESPEAQAGRLLVTSMFYTLQGEGPLRGEPAFFIRLAKCNLACSFCDTYFSAGTWYTPEDLYREAGERINRWFEKHGGTPVWAAGQTYDEWKADSPKEVARGMGVVVSETDKSFYTTHPLKGASHATPRGIALVITGGEPTLQPNLRDLLTIMRPQFTRMQIETNGLLAPDVPNGTIVVCSPKCNERDGFPTAYLRPNPATLERADCLKFVMSAPNGEDRLNPYDHVPAWAHAWRQRTGRPVFVSPMNIYRKHPQRAKEMRALRQGESISIDERSDVDEVISFWEDGLLDMAENKRNHEHTARYAIQHGFTFGVQIHLLASVA